MSRNLPPLRGGIERLMARVVEALAAEYDCYVIGPTGCAGRLPAGIICREISPFVPWFLLRGALQALAWRLRYRFALSVAGNALVAPLAWLGSRSWMGFVHGLDIVAPYRVYQWCFIPVLRTAQALLANSGHTRDLVVQRGVAVARVQVVHPGVAAPTSPATHFRARFGIGDGPLLLSVGRLVPRKGFAEFVASALPAVLQRCPGAQYVIVGAEAPHAASPRSGMREQIEAAARDAGVGGSVRLVGGIDDADLAAAYAEADVLVFPSSGHAGDVEGFGMVLLEAAAHGTPAVAFDTGGVRDAVAAESGILVRDGDFAGFAAAVATLLGGHHPTVTDAGCRRHAATNSWAKFDERVRDIARAAAGP